MEPEHRGARQLADNALVQHFRQVKPTPALPFFNDLNEAGVIWDKTKTILRQNIVLDMPPKENLENLIYGRASEKPEHAKPMVQVQPKEKNLAAKQTTILHAQSEKAPTAQSHSQYRKVVERLNPTVS